jgi:hypothetical protein
VYARAWNGGKDIVVPSGQRFNKPIPPPEALLAVYPLGKGPAPPPSGLLLRRSAIERVGGFEASFRGVLALYEDQAFLAKLYLEVPVLFSDRVWLFYRQHEDSIVASVVAQGRYHEVRRHFLEWFERRLKRHPGVDRRVRVAVWRALLPYRVPGGTWMLRHRPDRRLIGTLRAFRQFLRAGRPIGRVGISASDAPAIPAAEAAPRPEGACLNAATSPCERLPGFRR